MEPSAAPSLRATIAAYGVAIETGHLLERLRAARAVQDAEGDADALAPKERALLQDAFAHLSANDMRFEDAAALSGRAAESWRAAGEHAHELSSRMDVVSAQISALDSDAIAIAPLADKQDHLLTALRAAAPSPRRLLDAILASGYAALRVHRFDRAREHFAEAQSRARDDADRARVLGASALCELDAGDGDTARVKAAESIRLARSSGDSMQLATMLRFVTGIQGERPDELPSALQAAQEAAELAAELGDVFLASTLRLRGLLRITADDGKGGAEDLERSIRLLRESAWQATLPAEVLTLGQVMIGTGAPDDAARIVREHEDLLARAEGDQRIEVDLLRYQVAVHCSDLRSAATHAESAAERMTDAHHKAASTVWEAAASAWEAAGEAGRARAALERSRRLQNE